MAFCDVWLLDSPEMVLNFALQGGKVILITEDEDPRLQYIPDKIKATILLPPYDALSDELDGNLLLAQDKYYRHLSFTAEASEFITVILAAACHGIRLGLYFGEQLKDLKFPGMLMNYLEVMKGLHIGYVNSYPFIADEYMPNNLTELYSKGYITPEMFLLNMPIDFDIPPIMLQVLIKAFRPVFVDGDDYNGYFKGLIKRIKQAGKYLWSPVKAPEMR